MIRRSALTVTIMLGVAGAVALAGWLLTQVSLGALNDIALGLMLGAGVSYVVFVVGYICWLVAGAVLNE